MNEDVDLGVDLSGGKKKEIFLICLDGRINVAYHHFAHYHHFAP